MPPTANGDNPFQLDFSGVVAKTVRQHQRQASREGRGKEFVLAVSRIIKRLQREPFGFGEPLYRLPILRMQVRCAVIGLLYVEFAVCEDRPLVILRAAKLLAK